MVAIPLRNEPSPLKNDNVRSCGLAHLVEVMRWFVLLGIAACGSPPPRVQSPKPQVASSQPPYAADLAARCERHDQAPAGSPNDYVAPVIGGFTIAPPEMCGDKGYIRIERVHGSRKLGKGIGRSGGFSEGCMQAPTSPAGCPEINIVVPIREVTRELERRGLPSGGPGLGPCGKIEGDYDAWKMSVKVLSWAHAAQAVELVAAAFDRYDIAGDVGVAVEGVLCVEWADGASGHPIGANGPLAHLNERHILGVSPSTRAPENR